MKHTVSREEASGGDHPNITSRFSTGCDEIVAGWIISVNQEAPKKNCVKGFDILKKAFRDTLEFGGPG